MARADTRTGIYAIPSPGGRHLLGFALTAVYEPHCNPLFMLAPGDEVRFVPGEGARLAEPEGRLAEMVQAVHKSRLLKAVLN